MNNFRQLLNTFKPFPLKPLSKMIYSNVHFQMCSNNPPSNQQYENKIIEIPINPPLNQSLENNIQTSYTERAASYTLGPIEELKGTRHGGDLYALMFTCTPCGNRMTRTFTKNAYHAGVVLISCDQCNNTHLIADNLGWFDDNKWNVEIHAGAKRIDKPQVDQIIQEFLEKIKNQ